MAASKKELIISGLASRLETITAANGYDTDVQAVYLDEIPMSLDLDEYQLPAILIVCSHDKLERKHQWVHGNWNVEIQLIHNEVDDATMHRFVRDVAKAVFANSPTAARNEAWRGPAPTGIHESLYNIWQLEIESDLNMIDANRFFIVNYLLQYQTRPHDL